ncbi:MAG: hypothetical protein IKZ84_13625, partial [Victivallales bacterium]|nr:hypothetical protein [Victivallales bacterium]
MTKIGGFFRRLFGNRAAQYERNMIFETEGFPCEVWVSSPTKSFKLSIIESTGWRRLWLRRLDFSEMESL